MEDVPFREMVGSLMWIANQTRSEISNAIPAIARFSHDPKKVYVKAATKILEYLIATAYLGITFSRDSDLEDAELRYGLETYVDEDYANKAENRRSVSGGAVYYGGSLVSWFGEWGYLGVMSSVRGSRHGYSYESYRYRESSEMHRDFLSGLKLD